MQDGLHRFSRSSLTRLRRAVDSGERNRTSLACDLCKSENWNSGRAVSGTEGGGASRVARESLAVENVIRDDRPPGALLSVADHQGILIVERNTDRGSGIWAS